MTFVKIQKTKGKEMKQSTVKDAHLYCDDVVNLYEKWPSPTVIISDGPYGVSGFKGDLATPRGLAEWYEPHIEEWSKKASPITTLWFWNTEIGWATVHPVLEKHGWDYAACCVWNKGMSHVAGNINTKTIRHLPIVSEVCVQYVKRPSFVVDNNEMTMKEWLRYEWARTGLPFSKTNEACGVVDAATRKYFTKCHLWYMPPVDAFQKLVDYANNNGDPNGRPYFSVDGDKSLSSSEWARMRAKFNCPMGVTNVWEMPQLRNKERVKINQKAFHLNQKPLALIEKIIEMTSDENDIIWDPFAGLFTTAIAANKLNRTSYCAELEETIFEIAEERVKNYL